ncbi:MAG: hypothetical protein AABY22_16795 [Nanoarchaeota archaeon]
MTKKYGSCVKKINKKIKKGEIPKTYMKKGKRKNTNAHAICKSRMSAREFNKKYWGEPRW